MMHTPDRPLTITLPTACSPQQALAAYDLLYNLLHALWFAYRLPRPRPLWDPPDGLAPQAHHCPQQADLFDDQWPF